MSKLSFVLLATLAVAGAGCKKQGPSDCDRAIDHSMELSKADMQRMGVDATSVAQMTAIGKQHCVEDQWSADAVKCMLDAKTEQQAQVCYHNKMTSAQQTKMNTAVNAVVKTPDPSVIPAPVAGSGAPTITVTPSAGPAARAAGSASP